MTHHPSRIVSAGLALCVTAVFAAGCSSSDGGGGTGGDDPDGITVIDGPAQVDDDTGGAQSDD